MDSSAQDPWDLFEAAVLMSGESRVVGLELCLRALSEESANYPEADLVELKACVVAVLAEAGHRQFDAAVNLVDEAGARGRGGWPSFYLAEAALSLGEYQVVLTAVGSIPRAFFEERDLRWRKVRTIELEAIALLEQGGVEQAVERVSALAAEYAHDADEDCLASPAQLVHHLLGHVPQTCEALVALRASIDFADWLTSDLNARVERTIALRC